MKSNIIRNLSRKLLNPMSNLSLRTYNSSMILESPIISTFEYNLNETNHYKFKVTAIDPIFVLNVINIPPKLIITSTNSRIVRIWSLFGDSLCILDID